MTPQPLILLLAVLAVFSCTMHHGAKPNLAVSRTRKCKKEKGGKLSESDIFIIYLRLFLKYGAKQSIQKKVNEGPKCAFSCKNSENG
jgi:hypothetical protein